MTSEILRNEECNPNLLKKKGLELLDAGKTNEAVECFSKGLVYAPFDSLMRFWRGRKLIGREEYTQSDRKSTRLNSSHYQQSRMPSSA